MNPHELQIPAAVADWMASLLWMLIVLALGWAALAALLHGKRRAYNLSPVETAGGKDIRPDFLKVDQAARQRQIDRGEAFSAGGDGLPEAAPRSTYDRALSLTRVAGIFVALSSFVMAVIFAFVRIEFIEATWQKYSAIERLAAILQQYPVGFGVAIVVIVNAFVRLILTLRGKL